MFFVSCNFLLIFGITFSYYLGYKQYVALPKTSQTIDCTVIDIAILKTQGLQIVYTAKYNVNKTERISKIFSNFYPSYTNALEAAEKQHQVRTFHSHPRGKSGILESCIPKDSKNSFRFFQIPAILLESEKLP